MNSPAKYALSLLFVACLASLSFAASNVTNKEERIKQIKAHQEYVLKHSGGFLIRPSKGFVAVVDKESNVSSDIDAAVKELAKSTNLDIRKVADETAAKDAGLTIRIIEDAAKPPMLVAPEMGWAEVNVAVLVDDLKNESAKKAALSSRARKMFLRAFVYAAGAGGSSFPNNILDIVTIRDLDYREEFIPADAQSAALSHLVKRGVEPSGRTTYRKACMDGWAPSPTNDIQKAIWDKVHSMPKNPMNIEYDPKKGR